MSFTLNGTTFTPLTAGQHASNQLADMNNQLISAGLPTLTASQSNALWWTLLAQGTENALQDQALLQASNSMNVAICDDAQILQLLPTMGTALIPASPTSVTLSITATSAGCTIPAGSTAVFGNLLFATIVAITIGPSATATVGATCTVNGPNTVAASSITSFNPTIAGVSTVTNPSAGLVGRNIETVSACRTRLLAGGAMVNGITGAITALQSLPGITSAFIWFNQSTLSPLALLGYGASLAARNAIIFVVGDNPTSIATAYFTYMNAPTQAGFSANQTSNYLTSTTTPQTLVVNYEQAASQNVYVQVSYVSNPNVPSNILTLIQNVITPLNGTFQIGQKIASSPFYAAFVGFSQAQILGIALSLVGTSGPWTNTVQLNANGYANFANANIVSVAV